MYSKVSLFGSVVFCFSMCWATPNTVAPMGAVKLKGPIGARLDQMLKNHVCATDVDYITAPFLAKAERGKRWHTEFWGKYMHAAVPFWQYTGNAELKQAIDFGIARIVGSQESCGYIGNYPDELRCGAGWDVWGMKYTMLGLLHYYDGTRDERALQAARKLCDYLIAELGPGGKRGHAVWQTGAWSGLASCSVLEPVVWLYERTDDKRYLAFADAIVYGMTEEADGPRLLDLALKGISPADRNKYGKEADKEGGYVVKHNRRKAYEMMSCYQGFISYARVKGREDLLKAACATAEMIVRDEINLAGGAASSELWFHGSRKQHHPHMHLQETCVTTTWMRLAETLLAVTGDPKWADELERTFYNAYLAALNAQGDTFAAYTPLNGSRCKGHDHCDMHTNCCNANGPRGFLAFLRALLQANGTRAIMNFYVSGRSEIEVPATHKKVVFETYTYYPRVGSVHITNHTPETGDFTFALRIPACCNSAVVRVNGKPVPNKAVPGKYLDVTRTWTMGDVVDIDFDLAVKAHENDHYVAYTRGPILLARDSQFEDGPIDEIIPVANWGAKSSAAPTPKITLVRSSSPAVWMTFTATMRMGSHQENRDARAPVTVHFCDYASAGNPWSPKNAYRTWLPLEYSCED